MRRRRRSKLARPYDCTLVIVAHRLATVRDADSIIVFDQGRVSAQGTHDELLEQSPLYWELAHKQLLVD